MEQYIKGPADFTDVRGTILLSLNNKKLFNLKHHNIN